MIYHDQEVVFPSIGYVDNLANNLRDVAGILMAEARTNRTCGRCMFLEQTSTIFEEAVQLQIYSRHFTQTRAERESAKAGPSPTITNRNAHTPHLSCVIHQPITCFGTLLCLALHS